MVAPPVNIALDTRPPGHGVAKMFLFLHVPHRLCSPTCYGGRSGAEWQFRRLHDVDGLAGKPGQQFGRIEQQVALDQLRLAAQRGRWREAAMSTGLRPGFRQPPARWAGADWHFVRVAERRSRPLLRSVEAVRRRLRRWTMLLDVLHMVDDDAAVMD